MNLDSKKLFLLGCRAAGKTSFLTGLYFTSMRDGSSPFTITPNDDVTRREFTILKEYADRQMWPPATSTLSPLNFGLSYNSSNYQLSVLDYPGEDLKKAMESMTKESYDELNTHIESTDCLLILVDPTQDLYSEFSGDHKLVEQRQDALKTAIGHLMDQRHKSGGRKPIVYLVITKSDLIPNINNLIQDNTDLIMGLRNYSRTEAKILPISAVGETNSGNYPEHPSPDGYNNLFKHLRNDLSFEFLATSSIVRKGAVAAIIVLVVTLTLFFHFRNSNIAEINTLKNGKIEDVQKLTENKRSPNVEFLEALDERVRSEITGLKVKSSSCKTSDDFERIKEKLQLLTTIKHIRTLTEIQDIQASHNIEYSNLIYSQIDQAQQAGNYEKTEQKAFRYRKIFPKGEHTSRVKEIITDLSEAKRKRLIRNIQEIAIDDSSSLRSKVVEIGHYLNAYPSHPDKENISLAVILAQQLANAAKAELGFKRLHIGGAARDIKVELKKGDAKSLIIETGGTFLGDENTKFDLGKEFEVSAKSFTDLEIIITDLDLINELIGKIDLNLIKDLQHLNSSDYSPSLRDGEDGHKSTRKGLKILLHLGLKGADGKYKKISSEQATAYGKYIYPGTAWK